MRFQRPIPRPNRSTRDLGLLSRSVPPGNDTGRLHSATITANELSNDRRTDKSRGSRYKHFHSSSFLTQKRFSDHFFALLPKRFGSVGIKRVSTDSFACGANRNIVWDHLTYVAVLTVFPTNLLGRSNHRCPDRSCCSLRNCLPRERTLTLCCKLFFQLGHHPLYHSRIHVAAQRRLYYPRMDSSGTNVAAAIALVKGNCKKDVCGLRSAVCQKGIIRSSLKIGIVKFHIREAVA